LTTRRGAEEASGGLTRRGQRTRAALVQAGREVFEDRGYPAARVSDVCARAGVGHGTFYTYFDGKPDLLEAVVAAAVGDMFAASRPRESPLSGVRSDPYQRIEAANRRYLKAAVRNARLLRVFDQVAGDDPRFGRLRLDVQQMFASRVADGLRSLQQEGRADPTLPTDMAAHALGAMVERFAQVWPELGGDVEQEEVVATLTRLWARAIGLRRRRAPVRARGGNPGHEPGGGDPGHESGGGKPRARTGRR
jgi:AcrR family transcriptional regulator